MALRPLNNGLRLCARDGASDFSVFQMAFRWNAGWIDLNHKEMGDTV